MYIFFKQDFHKLDTGVSMPVPLAIQEVEIRRIEVRSQPRHIVCETLSQKKTLQKKRAGGVAQGVGPEFKPQYRKKKDFCKFFLEH
jgi:hypothetical protein